MKSPMSKEITRIVLVGVGLTSLCALVVFAGPLVAIGNYRPLETPIGRGLAVLFLVAAVGAFAGFQLWRRKKNTAALAAGVAGAEQKESDEPVLKDKMKDALTTLKTASGGRKDYLYDLPWYLLIGPPGSGKTTALVNSGLKFPLARGATPAAVAGLGGTRYCDWWFTEDAVLIDTAGRYTTQDSDAQADKQSWLAFLALLKKNRPRQPINGVIVAISLQDLMTLSPADLAAHSNAIRTRLLELHERLKVDFPVYALFTKGDLVAGFIEYFGYLSEDARKQVWGATFQTKEKSRNMVAEIPAQYDALLERLSEETLDRLQDEPVPDTRVLLFGFPAQMARLKKPIYDFLNQIFEPTRYHANAALRGFYFTSGTQEGNPIDQLIGALVRTFGAEEVAATSHAGPGKSYFLHDLILKVIIGEAAWVSTDWAAVRRNMIMKGAALSAIALVSIFAASAWLTSYQRNSALIAQTDTAQEAYANDADHFIHEQEVADHDLHLLLAPLYELRTLPAGYASRLEGTPVVAGFGLSQRERLLSASENAYRIGLERMFRSRLIFRLEGQLHDQLKSKAVDPGFLYAALKVYLMLGGQGPEDRKVIRSWMERDWGETLYPGASNTAGRQALEEHLDAMLDLESGEPLLGLDGLLVAEAQSALSHISVAQRAYGLLKSQALASHDGDWVAAQKGGLEVLKVFEAVNDPTLQTVRVPEFFTYNGFHHDFIDQLGDIAERVRQERWVLGAAGEQTALTDQFDNLPDTLLVLYTREFVAAWQQALARLRFHKLLADKPQYFGLSALSAATSPLKQLIESIVQETAVTRERAPGGQAPAAGGGTATAAPAKRPTVLFKTQTVPGAEIEAAFKPYQILLEGEPARRAIDDAVAITKGIETNLRLMATTPAQAPKAIASLQESVSRLRGTGSLFPPPFSDMLLALAADVEHEAGISSAAAIAAELRDKVKPACLKATSGYPFVKGDLKDPGGVSPEEFGRVFGAGGVMETFFKQRLESLVDSSKPNTWTWRPDGNELEHTLLPDTLKQFQLALYIQRAFFQNNGPTPFVQLVVTPNSLTVPSVVAKLEIGGAPPVANPTPPPPPSLFSSPPPPPPTGPAQVQWQGAPLPSRITVAPAAPGAKLPEANGPWSMFKLFEMLGLSPSGSGGVVRYLAPAQAGQIELQYTLVSAASANPLNLAVLRQFKCPSGI
jgi:type VI secretion system protein ImpL